MSSRRVIPPLIAALLVLALTGCGSSGSQVSPSDSEKAVDEAQAAFRQIQASGQHCGFGGLEVGIRFQQIIVALIQFALRDGMLIH